mgnify:CR=1 FL=1
MRRRLDRPLMNDVDARYKNGANPVVCDNRTRLRRRGCAIPTPRASGLLHANDLPRQINGLLRRWSVFTVGRAN